MAQASGTTTNVRAAFLVLLLWAIAYAHPVPGRESVLHYHSAQQEDTASEDYSNKLGNPQGGGRHSPASAGGGDNSLVRDPTAGNTVGEELGRHGGHDKAGRAGEVQHLNQVDHEDASAWDGNGLGFLEEDARDTDDGEHRGPAVGELPSHAAGFLDEEDESGDDTFDENGEEERGEGPTYVVGADGEEGHGHDAGRGDTGAGGGHGDSSSSSSSESAGEDHWRYRSYLGRRYEQPYRQGGHSSSSQQEEEESYGFEDEAMQGDDPSVFDGLGSSYRGHRAGPRALGSSRESGQGAGSHRWEEGDSRSPELEDPDSGEDSPSEEDNSESEEPSTSRSEEGEGGEDGEDSPSRESENSESSEDTVEQADQELRESPEDTSRESPEDTSRESPEDTSRESPEDTSRESPEDTSRELVSLGSQSREEQKDQEESAEDRSEPSAPESESEEEEGKPSESQEDVSEQSQSTEDTAEESQEDENDSEPTGDAPSASAESQSSSLQDDGSQESVAGEDSSSTESTDSESQQEEEEESYSQEDASSSRGDASSPQSLESSSRRRRPGAYRHKPAADYDDNDCQDGY